MLVAVLTVFTVIVLPSSAPGLLSVASRPQSPLILRGAIPSSGLHQFLFLRNFGGS